MDENFGMSWLEAPESVCVRVSAAADLVLAGSVWGGCLDNEIVIWPLFH